MNPSSSLGLLIVINREQLPMGKPVLFREKNKLSFLKDRFLGKLLGFSPLTMIVALVASLLSFSFDPFLFAP